MTVASASSAAVRTLLFPARSLVLNCRRKLRAGKSNQAA
jgi:hypothetical protein